MSSKRITWISESDAPEAFPDVVQALREPDGLLAAGGNLDSARLLAAYKRGIFPWYEEGQPVLWWSPDPRCVLDPAGYHVSRRLAREIRSSRLVLRFNSAFAQVITACAGPRRSQQGTWITRDMHQSFLRLHDEGWAHSVEVWSDDDLVGGVYGLAIGRVFFGESMFSAVSNASKIALLALTSHMRTQGMPLLDCQVVSPHLLDLGATTIPRQEFIESLAAECEPAVPAKHWPSMPTPAEKWLRQ